MLKNHYPSIHDLQTTSEKAIQTVEKWVDLANSSSTIQVTENIMKEMAQEISELAYTSYEWIGLTAAINFWFENYVQEPSFFTCIIEKLRTQS